MTITLVLKEGNAVYRILNHDDGTVTEEHIGGIAYYDGYAWFVRDGDNITYEYHELKNLWNLLKKLVLSKNWIDHLNKYAYGFRQQ